MIGKLVPAGTGYRGDNRFSDGPIDSYEGIALKAAPTAGMEEVVELELGVGAGAEVEAETPDILGVVPAMDASTEEKSEAETDSESAPETSDILGVVTKA